MKAAFEAAHRARFGFVDETKALVVEAVSVEAVGGGAKFSEPSRTDDERRPPRADATHALLLRTAWHEAACLSARRSSRPATRIAGPALLIEPHQTVVVEAGWGPRSRRATIWS